LVVEWGRIDRGEADHVHLLVRYPPTLAISLLVQRLKGRIAGGAPLSIIKQYIDSQARPL
jgi:putative transposase